MNNKAFILYDGLISFIILTSFICFFSLFININQKHSYANDIKLEALLDLRNSAYNYYEEGELLSFNTSELYSTQQGDEYCINYKEGDESVCI